MQEDFSRYLSTLLYQHDRLSIPGLGSFELTYEPAMIDQIQGQVAPPSKAVAFNPNLVMDDGLLVELVSQEQQLSAIEAKAWVEQQVEVIKSNLAQRQIVELAGVGRFFRNIKQELQFVTDKENYNLEAYGLASVAASPVARHGTAARTTTSTASAAAKKEAESAKRASTTYTNTAVSTSISGWFQRNLALIAVLSVFIVGFALYFLFLRPKAQQATDPTADIPTERLNASPSKEEPNAEVPPAIAEADPENSPTDNNLDTEAPTIGPDEHSAVIAVGLFQNVDYVERLVEKLYAAGFEAYTAKENDLTRVGVMVRYEEESELEDALREVKAEFESSAFIMIKDGNQVERN